jgi:hypothetical protein
MTTNILLALFVYFLLPETSKVPLEEMDRLFGGVSHVEKGAAIVEMDDVKAADQAQTVEIETPAAGDRK